MGREKFNADDAAYSENLVDLMQQSGFQVLWKDNDDGCKGVCNRVPNEEMVKKNDIRYCDGKSCFDEVLLEDLEDYLGNVTKDAFIVLHTMGSHGRPITNDIRPHSKSSRRPAIRQTSRNVPVKKS